jgi:hypothetical protein
VCRQLAANSGAAGRHADMCWHAPFSSIEPPAPPAAAPCTSCTLPASHAPATASQPVSLAPPTCAGGVLLDQPLKVRLARGGLHPLDGHNLGVHQAGEVACRGGQGRWAGWGVNTQAA